ncbi:MAG: hypothetical protein IPI67_39975 [Myxococcales bacterium]|nr:hypothetical protein [Myxococcales bacterium]
MRSVRRSPPWTANSKTPAAGSSCSITLTSVTVPMEPSSTGFTVDLSASPPPGNLTPCKPVHFSGRDSCGRALDFDVQLSWTTESNTLTLTCPAAADASTD